MLPAPLAPAQGPGCRRQQGSWPSPMHACSTCSSMPARHLLANEPSPGDITQPDTRAPLAHPSPATPSGLGPGAAAQRGHQLLCMKCTAVQKKLHGHRPFPNPSCGSAPAPSHPKCSKCPPVRRRPAHLALFVLLVTRRKDRQQDVGDDAVVPPRPHVLHGQRHVLPAAGRCQVRVWVRASCARVLCTCARVAST